MCQPERTIWYHDPVPVLWDQSSLVSDALISLSIHRFGKYFYPSYAWRRSRCVFFCFFFWKTVNQWPWKWHRREIQRSSESLILLWVPLKVIPKFITVACGLTWLYLNVYPCRLGPHASTVTASSHSQSVKYSSLAGGPPLWHCSYPSRLSFLEAPLQHSSKERQKVRVLQRVKTDVFLKIADMTEQLLVSHRGEGCPVLGYLSCEFHVLFWKVTLLSFQVTCLVSRVWRHP